MIVFVCCFAEDASEYREVQKSDKRNNDAVSTPGYDIKKNDERGA